MPPVLRLALPLGLRDLTLLRLRLALELKVLKDWLGDGEVALKWTENVFVVVVKSGT